MRNMEKYGTAGQATDDNIIQRMRNACWITKATDTHSEYVILTAFREVVGYVKTQLTCILFIMPTTCFGHCGQSSGRRQHNK